MRCKSCEAGTWTASRSYGGGRNSDVKTAGASIVYYENWKSTREQHLLDAIEAYNLEDVQSTHALREWLIRLRPADATWLVPGSTSGSVKSAKPKSEKTEEAAAELERYGNNLSKGCPKSGISGPMSIASRSCCFTCCLFIAAAKSRFGGLCSTTSSLPKKSSLKTLTI